MSIDFASFTPGGSLAGGLAIGAAAAVLVLFNGRIAGISGILGGLIVSGMANPAKVLGFLDIAGQWDPSLAFVMVEAIAVGSIAFGMARRRRRFRAVNRSTGQPISTGERVSR